MLTDRQIKKLIADGKPGLTPVGPGGLSLRISGKVASWSLWYRVKASRVGRRESLGRVKDVTLGDARERAREIRNRVAGGADPVAERRALRSRLDAEAGAPTFRWLLDKYVREQGPNLRARTLREITRAMGRDVLPAIGDKKLADIATADVQNIIREVKARGSAVQGARTFAYLRMVYRWSTLATETRARIVDPVADPTLGLRIEGEAEERQRIYSADELRQLWAGVTGSEIADLVPLILLTAARSEEARSMRWADIDWQAKTWTVPGTLSKNGKPHTVPLTTGALLLLAGRAFVSTSEFVFPASTREGYMDAPQKTIDRLRKAGEVPTDFRLHDCRRTVAAGLASMGISSDIIERCLNHVPAKLIRTYQVNTRLPERTAALEAWDRHLSSILTSEQRRDNVVPMTRKAG